MPLPPGFENAAAMAQQHGLGGGSKSLPSQAMGAPPMQPGAAPPGVGGGPPATGAPPVPMGAPPMGGPPGGMPPQAQGTPPMGGGAPPPPMPPAVPPAPQGNAWGHNFMEQFGKPPGQMRDEWAAFKTQNGFGGGARPVRPVRPRTAPVKR